MSGFLRDCDVHVIESFRPALAEQVQFLRTVQTDRAQLLPDVPAPRRHYLLILLVIASSPS